MTFNRNLPSRSAVADDIPVNRPVAGHSADWVYGRVRPTLKATGLSENSVWSTLSDDNSGVYLTVWAGRKLGRRLLISWKLG